MSSTALHQKGPGYWRVIRKCNFFFVLQAVLTVVFLHRQWGLGGEAIEPVKLPPSCLHKGVGVSLNPLRLMAASLLQGVAPCKPPLAPPGSDHHHLHLSPQQLSALGSVDCFIWVGEALEGDLLPLLRGMAPGASLNLIEALRASEEAREALYPQDHHLWLSPELALPSAQLIAKACLQLYPQDSERIIENLAQFKAGFQRFESRWRRALQPYSGIRWGVTHHDFQALSSFLGLSAPASLPLFHELTPSPHRLLQWQALQKQSPLQYVVLEGGHPPHMTHFFEGLGIHVVELATLAETWDELRIASSLEAGESPYFSWLHEICSQLESAARLDEGKPSEPEGGTACPS